MTNEEKVSVNLAERELIEVATLLNEHYETLLQRSNPSVEEMEACRKYITLFWMHTEEVNKALSS